MKKRRSVSIVHADRGRGKSAALGIFTAQLASSTDDSNMCVRVIVTAAKREALCAYFERLEALCLTGIWNEDIFSTPGLEVRYRTPYQLKYNHFASSFGGG